MKRSVKQLTFLALSALSASLLLACSSQSNSGASTASTSTSPSTEESTSSRTSASTSQASSTVEEKKVDSSVSKMTISNLANGDYSSIAGVWQDAAGNQLTFDSQGLVSASENLPGVSVTDYGTAAGGVYGGSTGGFLIEFIPAGVTIQSQSDAEGNLLFADDSDSSRDRIWTGIGIQSFQEAGQFYYRVSQ